MGKTWPMVSLGELLTPISRAESVAADRHYDILGARWYAKGLYIKESKYGSEIAASKVYRVEKGDFVYNRLFAWKGSFALATEEDDGCHVSNEFPCFAVNRSRLEPRFLLHYFSREPAWSEALGLSSGGTPTSRNRLKEAMLLRMAIPLPSLPEQRRIVAKVEELAAKIEEASGLRRTAIDEASILLKSCLHRICNAMTRLGCLGQVLTDKPRNGWSVRCDNTDGGVPVLTLSAVTGYRYDGSAVKLTSSPVDTTAHYWAKEGELLMTRSNTPELVGHAALHDGTPERCIYPDLMMKLPVDEANANKRFVWYWLQSPLVRAFISANAKGTSPTMKKISQPTVMQIPFPEKVSLPEQRRIVAYLDDLQAKVDALKALQAQSAAELDALLPSILDKAFKGEL